MGRKQSPLSCHELHMIKDVIMHNGQLASTWFREYKPNESVHGEALRPGVR